MNYLPVLGLLIFFGALLVVSVVLARKTKRRLTSAIVATFIAAVLVQAISYAHVGYFDPFYQIAFVTSIVIGFPISLLVVYVALRGRSEEQRSISE
jgi:multisubunit Na+/H+ antiporter MnhC subunit